MEELVDAGSFRLVPKTAMRWRKPIAIGEKYGSWHIEGYGELYEKDGQQLYAGTCEGCGCKSHTLLPNNLRKGQYHSCYYLRDRAGFTANGYTVVRTQWHEDAVHWLVRNTASGEEELWSPPRVEIELVGDLTTIDAECAKAIRDAAFKGEDSPMLRELETTVAEVQFYLPLAHKRKGDALGHIFPRKLCPTPRTRVASWHPRLLRWIDPKKNSQMCSLAWVSQYADPVVVAASQALFAMCLEDLYRLFPEGRMGSESGQGGISAKRRERFGLPTRKAEWAAWRREETAIRGMYEGYADPATLDGSEVYGGYDLTFGSP